MKILIYHFVFACLLLLPVSLSAKQPRRTASATYVELRSRYEHKGENDESALPYVTAFLKKAQKEKNYEKILLGYEDMTFYSPKREAKLRYADSSINYALKSNNNELISSAYLGKGIIYYFFYRQYQPALNEYLKAYEYSKTIKDQYLKYRVIYQLGVVKSYLGYYDEALKLFDECIAYFEPLTWANIHPNLIFNNQKGYFNSLHQEIACYRAMGNYLKSDSLISIGLSALPRSKEFALEKSYFLKCRGIADYREGNYAAAIKNLNDALAGLTKIDDFMWTSVSYFYIGESYLKQNNESLAISYFMKVDSIFQKQQFILPEIRGNYEILIDYYHKTENYKQELHYATQLLKVDSILNRDFKYLSSKIHKEYDTKALLEKQEKLESRNLIEVILLTAAGLLVIALSVILIYRNKKKKEVERKYKELEERIIGQEYSSINKPLIAVGAKERKIEVPSDVINTLLYKLAAFEAKEGFRKKGIALPDLAKKFETNTSYLSQVINEYKGKNFNSYINELRINYVTQKLYHDAEYLSYTIEALADDCGVSSRQSFSNLFNEINGLRPADFIKKRRTEKGWKEQGQLIMDN